MKREDQLKLLESAEERTIGYLHAWLKNDKFRMAVRRQDRARPEDNNHEHYVARVKKRVCA